MIQEKAKPQPKPWEPQEKEPIIAFRYFSFYRDMQRRSLRLLSKTFNHRSTRRVEKLSVVWNWQERAHAWDTELDRRLRNMQVGEVAKMRERHTNIGIGMQTAATKDLHAWVEKINEAAAEAKKAGKAFHNPILSISDIIRLTQVGTGIERLNKGEPTGSIEVITPEDEALAALSVEQLRALNEIKAALK